MKQGQRELRCLHTFRRQNTRVFGWLVGFVFFLLLSLSPLMPRLIPLASIFAKKKKKRKKERKKEKKTEAEDRLAGNTCVQEGKVMERTH